MPVNTAYNPDRVADFEKSKLTFNAIGVLYDSINLSGPTSLDLRLTEDHLLTGSTLIVKDPTFGDYVDFQVVDVDGIMAPAGMVLNQFITKWYMRSDSQMQFQYDAVFPAKIYAGLYLRGIYHSVAAVGGLMPKVVINYRMSKVLQ